MHGDRNPMLAICETDTYDSPEPSLDSHISTGRRSVSSTEKADPPHGRSALSGRHKCILRSPAGYPYTSVDANANVGLKFCGGRRRRKPGNTFSARCSPPPTGLGNGCPYSPRCPIYCCRRHPCSSARCCTTVLNSPYTLLFPSTSLPPTSPIFPQTALLRSSFQARSPLRSP